MLKLSDAMRLGAMLHQQTFGAMFRLDGNDVVATCAMGAARRACSTWQDEDISARWPIIAARAICPCGCGWFWSAGKLIVHLNDDQHWTRERIADWVETLEQTMEEPPSRSAVDPVEGIVTEVQRA